MVALTPTSPPPTASVSILPVALLYVAQGNGGDAGVRDAVVMFALERIGADGEHLYRGWSRVWETTLSGLALFSSAKDAAEALLEERQT